MSQQDDVEAILGRDLTVDEAARLPRLLELAAGAVEAALPGFTIAVGNETKTIESRGDGLLWTPRWPVASIDSISDADNVTVPASAYRHDDKGRIDLWCDEWGCSPVINASWRGWCGPFTIAYHYGFATLPNDLAGLIAAPVAARLRQQSTNPGNVAQDSETIGSYTHSVSYGTASDRASIAAGFAVSGDADALRRWRRQASAVLERR